MDIIWLRVGTFCVDEFRMLCEKNKLGMGTY